MILLPAFVSAYLPLYHFGKSDSLGTKLRRKRLWDYFGRRGSEQIHGCIAEASVECYGVDCRNTTEVIERRKSESVNLREEKPGEMFLPREIPEECTVKQLQRWLLSVELKQL